MQQFYIKFLVLLSTALSVHSALAVPLFSLLNVNHPSLSLSVDNTKQKQFFTDQIIIKEGIPSETSNIKLSHSLSLLLQHKSSYQFINELSLTVILSNDNSVAFFNSWLKSTYQQAFQQQQTVYSAIQAQQNSCFQSQTSYKTERQKNSPSTFLI